MSLGPWAAFTEAPLEDVRDLLACELDSLARRKGLVRVTGEDGIARLAVDAAEPARGEERGLRMEDRDLAGFRRDCGVLAGAIECHVEGTRLSDILRVAHHKRLQLDINAAICLIRQLVPAVAMLHENARDAAHGLISPERIIVTPHTRLLIVEHVLAAAIEKLQFGRERLWKEFRIAMPPAAGAARFDHRADVTGIGLVALALVLGRPIAATEFPAGIPGLLSEARERSPLGDEQPLSPALRAWLARALQLDSRRAFASAPEAMAGLEEVVADDSVYVAAPVALEPADHVGDLLERTYGSRDERRASEFGEPLVAAETSGAAAREHQTVYVGIACSRSAQR